ASLLMTSFGNLFGTIGNLTKAVPGYAEVLLQFGTDVLGMLENVSRAIEPALGWFLKLHGAIFYGGLAGTTAAWGFGKIVTGAQAAVTWLTKMAEAASWISNAGPIVKGLGAISKGLSFLGSTPVLVGIGLTVGAIAALVMYLRAGHTDAQAFGNSMQQ